jgi:alkanesulfonate monooxygenase SsuD/methylene tetrahydromethanopterin reductase-like flavin-dependent oxidoreductase (luciferase family)
MEQMEFGVVVHGVSSWSDLNRLVIRAEELGYGVVATPDHLGSAAPFTVLAAVAGMSSGLRLRTYMLNVGFWNSALLAREAATVDVLSDGRLELGLGAGHMKREFETAEIAWTPWNNASRDSAERRSKCVKCSPI